MPRVNFTPNLRKHLDCPPRQVEAATLREALEAIFLENPRLRGYILDDQHRLRQHVVVFVDSEVVTDRIGLQDPVGPGSEIYVMQALSGG